MGLSDTWEGKKHHGNSPTRLAKLWSVTSVTGLLSDPFVSTNTSGKKKKKHLFPANILAHLCFQC